MNAMEELGKVLIFLGVFLVVFGLLMLVLSKFPLPFGNLPGDIKIQRDNFTIYIPIASSIILSLILTALLNLIFVLINKR